MDTAMHHDALHDLLSELAARHQVPGAQLAVCHEGERFVVHAGMADTASGSVVGPDTAFPVGSLTKPFTAGLAMILVADGDADLDEPLTGQLPEFDAGALITLRQLLSHTAGLPSDVPEGTSDVGGDRAVWVARHCRRRDLAHPPGTVFSYSNVGYVVVGRLVEALTGMTWQEAIGAILLEPLGLQPAFVAGPVRTGRPVAAGHAVQAARGRVVPMPEQELPEVELPNGGLALSAADLLMFAGLYFADCPDPKPLDRTTANDMCFDQLAAVAVGPYGMAEGWGLGWARFGDDGSHVYGHDGTGDGTSCHLRFDPVIGSAVALTTNANTGRTLWEDLAPRLRALGLAVGDRPELQPAAQPAGTSRPAAPDACLGRYTNGDTAFEVLRGDDGGLLLSFGGAPHSELLCAPDLRFVMRELGGGARSAGRFVTDPATGRIDYLQITGRLAARA
ncbi:serine hydrolase domain-containing protein [Streptomyces diacarni]|uniref:serine hydrolase domain-containing protein n=1 Tax=Streptomyces diacarni TaxID=2800381 RepID=UPI00340E0A02